MAGPVDLGGASQPTAKGKIVTEEELAQFRVEKLPPPPISISSLFVKRPRTLIWGYTHKRGSHHVYIKDNTLHLYVYRDGFGVGADIPPPVTVKYQYGSISASSLVPDKRVYPEACDKELCWILTNLGVYVPFTKFNSDRTPEQYYGKIYEGDQ